MLKPYYQDDAVTIYLGDALYIMPEINNIGSVVTDPPYSSGGMYRSDRMQNTVNKYVNSDTNTYRSEFAGDNRDQRSFFAWATFWLSAAYTASSPGAPLCVFTDWRQLPTMTDGIQAGGWIWRNICTWHKPGIRMQRGRFSSSAEYIIYATKGPAEPGEHSPQNVFQCKPATDKEHIAQKPEHSWAAAPHFAPRKI